MKLQFNFQMHAREEADHLKNGEAITNGDSTENDTHNTIQNEDQNSEEQIIKK